MENYFRFDEADIAIFIGVVFIALACLDERKKALQCVLHTCSKGRGRLAARRIGAMFFATAFFILVVKLSLLVTANVKYGGNIIRDICSHKKGLVAASSVGSEVFHADI